MLRTSSVSTQHLKHKFRGSEAPRSCNRRGEGLCLQRHRGRGSPSYCGRVHTQVAVGYLRWGGRSRDTWLSPRSKSRSCGCPQGLLTLCLTQFRLRQRCALTGPAAPRTFQTCRDAPQPPNLCGALTPESPWCAGTLPCAASPGLPRSQQKWVALSAHLPPPTPHPHRPRALCLAWRVSLSYTVSVSLNRTSVSVPDLSQSAPLRPRLDLPSSHTATGAPVSSPVLCPLVCPLYLLICLTTPFNPPGFDPIQLIFTSSVIQQTAFNSHFLGSPGARRSDQVRDQARAPLTLLDPQSVPSRPGGLLVRRRGHHTPGYSSPLPGLNSERKCLATSSW